MVPETPEQRELREAIRARMVEQGVQEQIRDEALSLSDGAMSDVAQRVYDEAEQEGLRSNECPPDSFERAWRLGAHHALMHVSEMLNKPFLDEVPPFGELKFDDAEKVRPHPGSEQRAEIAQGTVRDSELEQGRPSDGLEGTA